MVCADFPDRASACYADMRHLFIGCRNASGGFLTEDLTIEITNRSYETSLLNPVNGTVGPIS